MYFWNTVKIMVVEVVEAETDLLESIAEEQGHPEYVQLDKELFIGPNFQRFRINTLYFEGY